MIKKDISYFKGDFMKNDSPTNPVILIVCHNQNNYGIGLKGKLPWKNEEDLERFQRITDDGILIVGRKTAESLPRLKNRTIYIVSRETSSKRTTFLTVKEAIDRAKTSGKKIFIAGGAEIYAAALEQGLVDILDITKVNDETACDTFFPMQLVGSNFIFKVSIDRIKTSTKILEKKY